MLWPWATRDVQASTTSMTHNITVIKKGLTKSIHYNAALLKRISIHLGEWTGRFFEMLG